MELLEAAKYFMGLVYGYHFWPECQRWEHWKCLVCLARAKKKENLRHKPDCLFNQAREAIRKAELAKKILNGVADDTPKSPGS